MTFDFKSAEKRLWMEGKDAFRELMRDDCVMVLPMPRPVLDAERAIASLDGIPRWDEISFRSITQSGDTAVHMLGYEAEAKRGEDIYRAACLSVWADGKDGWRLVAHSQIPSGAYADQD